MKALQNTSTLNKPLPHSHQGFTLTEILLVIALIGVVMGLVVNQFSEIGNKAKISTTQGFVNNGLEANILMFQQEYGSYPSSLNELAPFLKGKKMPEDPWKTPYNYKYPGTHNTSSYDFWSSGPDKQNGTADDIGNW